MSSPYEKIADRFIKSTEAAPKKDFTDSFRPPVPTATPQPVAPPPMPMPPQPPMPMPPPQPPMPMPPPQEDPKIGFLEGALAMALGQLEKQESVPTAEPTLVPSGFEIRPEVGMTDPSRVFPDDTRRVRRVPTDLYAPPPEQPLIRPANYLGQPLPKSMGEVLDRLKTGGMQYVDFIRLLELLPGLPTELAGIGSESRYGGPPLKRPGQGFMKSVIERSERRPLINRILGDPASALPPVSSVNALSGLSAVRRTELIREVIGLGERTPQLMPELIRTIKSSLGRQLTNDEVNVIREKIGRELTDDEMRVVRETVVESPAGAVPQRPAGALPGVVERAPGYRADPVTDPSGVLGRGRGISPGARVSRPTQPRRAPGDHEELRQRLADLNRRIDELYTKDEFFDTDAVELDALNQELYAVEDQIAALPSEGSLQQGFFDVTGMETNETRRMALEATSGAEQELIQRAPLEATAAERARLAQEAERGQRPLLGAAPVVDELEQQRRLFTTNRNTLNTLHDRLRVDGDDVTPQELHQYHDALDDMKRVSSEQPNEWMGQEAQQLIEQNQLMVNQFRGSAKEEMLANRPVAPGPVVGDVADFKATILAAHRSVEGGRVEGLAENLLSTYGDAELDELLRWADTSDNAYIRNAIAPVIRRVRGSRAPQVAKEPWQMTREEFAAAVQGGKLYRADPISYTGAPRAGATDLAQGESAKYPAKDIAASYVSRFAAGRDLSVPIETGPVFRTLDTPTAEAIDLGRKEYIEDAIKEGKDVPDSVLREYPDLAPVAPARGRPQNAAEEFNEPIDVVDERGIGRITWQRLLGFAKGKDVTLHSRFPQVPPEGYVLLDQ